MSFGKLALTDHSLYECQLLALKRERVITANTYMVGLALRRRADRYGVCDPSLADLAELSGCVRSTVQLAVADLRNCGMISWRQRKVHNTLNLTNAYQLHTPVKPTHAFRKKHLRSFRPKIGIGRTVVAVPAQKPTLAVLSKPISSAHLAIIRQQRLERMRV